MASVTQTSGSSPLKFFLLTYAVTWTFFIAAAALSGSAANSPLLAGVRGTFFLVGTFAPAIVALSLSIRDEGNASALLRRTVMWRVAARWYLFAVSYMAAIKLAVALVHRFATEAWPRFGDETWYIILVAIIVSTPIQAGEEIGWRGYALPRLASRFGFARASLLLGVIWASWHLPLFFIPGIDKSGQSFPVYLLQVTALSVALAWLYAHTGGSLLLAMLMHSAVNETKDIVPSAVPAATETWALSTSLVAWLTVALLWIGAGYFLVRMPKAKVEHR